MRRVAHRIGRTAREKEANQPSEAAKCIGVASSWTLLKCRLSSPSMPWLHQHDLDTLQYASASLLPEFRWNVNSHLLQRLNYVYVTVRRCPLHHRPSILNFSWNVSPQFPQRPDCINVTLVRYIMPSCSSNPHFRWNTCPYLFQRLDYVEATMIRCFMHWVASILTFGGNIFFHLLQRLVMWSLHAALCIDIRPSVTFVLPQQLFLFPSSLWGIDVTVRRIHWRPCILSFSLICQLSSPSTAWLYRCDRYTLMCLRRSILAFC